MMMTLISTSVYVAQFQYSFHSLYSLCLLLWRATYLLLTTFEEDLIIIIMFLHCTRRK